MKVQITTYTHSSNGLAVQILPETDAEVALLKGVWNHGKMETGHPCGATGGIGFYIKAFCEQANELNGAAIAAERRAV